MPEVILFPDHGGIGLQNFVRLRKKLTTPCSFWMIPKWLDLLRKYGSNQIWKITQQEFVAVTTRLAEPGAPAELLALCAAMAREGLALEHEAVWLA